MYEREGLIIPQKTSGNQRNYSIADIDRLKCIRKAINEHKISINGIKTIYSLIPCWELVGCSDKDRQICKAFHGHTEPCWTYDHPNTACEKKDCYDCEVYLDYSNCGEVKKLIKKVTGKN
jgi:MerR family transcriptional regulator/heat shock protein HspR